jgi:diguanylate cyclase (GGDEF)-like protein
MGDLRFAISGAGALRLLAERPADLVLLDVSMPDMDGFATCAQIKAQYPDTAVIFVTAAHDVDSEIRALAVGAVDFIHKPISPPIVRARVSAHLKLKKQSDLLRELSNKDPLTGIPNRRALDERLALEWRRALRSGESVSLLMIDIDHFKAYNDHYGHHQGDNCLRTIAEAIAGAAKRASDLAARFGGEEFAVLLPHTSGEQALVVANKVCEAVRSLAIRHAPSEDSGQVTVSVGVGTLSPSAVNSKPADLRAHTADSGLRSARALFDLADTALYAAKEAGRDRAELGGQRKRMSVSGG